MKPALLAWALVAFSKTSVVSAAKGGQKIADEAINGQTEAAEDDEVKYTTFNGIDVPPMVDIDGKKFAETIQDGYW